MSSRCRGSPPTSRILTHGGSGSQQDAVYKRTESSNWIAQAIASLDACTGRKIAMEFLKANIKEVCKFNQF